MKFFSLFKVAVVMLLIASMSACGDVNLRNSGVSLEVSLDEDRLTVGIRGEADLITRGTKPAPKQKAFEPVDELAFGSDAKSLRSTKRLNSDQATVLRIIEEKALEYNVDPTALAAVGWIESRFRNVKNPNSTAAGIMQFIRSTAILYGLNDPYDISANVDAGARLMADNRRHLRDALGYEPQAWMLYLAHQQGATGAVNLLNASTSPARDIVGLAAVKLNTQGSADGSAAAFVEEWRTKFEYAQAYFLYD